MTLKVLYVVSFLDVFAFVLVITTINPFVYSLGGTQFYLGVLGSIGAFINLIWNPIVGSLSDTLGRKTILIQCILVCLVGNILSALSSSLTIFFIARIITTFGSQVGILLKSLVDDTATTQESKMVAINRMQAIGGSCFIFASLISGYLSELENGFIYVFWIISGIFLTNFVLLSVMVAEKSNKKKSPKSSIDISSEFKKAATTLSKVNWPKYWDLFTIKLIVDFVLTVFHFSMTQMLLRDFQIKGKYFGYVFSSVSIVGIITTLLIGRVKKMFYEGDTGARRLTHGCLLLIAGYLGLGLSPNFSTFYFFLTFITMGKVIFESTFTEVILARAGEHEKGSIMGTFETTLALAGLTAPIITGVVSDRWGTDKSMLFCTGPLVVGALVAYAQQRKQNNLLKKD